MKVFVTHPRVRDAKGSLLPKGEQDLDEKLARSLLKRKLATDGKKLEVATPKAEPKAEAKPDQKSGAGSQQKDS